jgi:hypothetical protein
MRNLLGVEKAKALIYIYTNSRFFRQRLGTNPVRYYDDNIFSEDSDHDGGALSETNDKDSDDNDDNNGNGGEGHDGNNGDSSGGGGEHHRREPPVILGNLHPKVVYDWNEINEGIANGVDEHATVGPIGNMHIDEDAPLRFAKHAYDRANEEPDDDNYYDVANEYGEENGNTHGRNGDGNDRTKGGAIGGAVGGNNDIAFVSSGDGGSSNIPQEAPY